MKKEQKEEIKKVEAIKLIDDLIEDIARGATDDQTEIQRLNVIKGILKA